ncbi:MAG: hypothetical protein R3F38_18950 [Gammaproteobacteria bacterium]
MGYSSHNISELQKTLAPSVYGPLDLDITPERFRTELGANSIKADDKRIQACWPIRTRWNSSAN